MNSCPNCGAALAMDGKYCPRCGAAVRMTKTRSINISLSRRDARRGCVRLLRYPGAPAPIKVRLPRGIKDGAELYLNEVPFMTGEGSVSRGALRICVRVKRRRVLPFVIMLFLLFTAGVAGWLLLEDVALPTPEKLLAALSPERSELTPSPEPTPQPTPEPTPYVPPLSPMQQQAAMLIPNLELRYYLMELDDRLLENFCALYRAVSQFEADCSFPQPLSREELKNLMLLLSYECPELLQFSSATEMSYLVDESGRVLSVQLELCLTAEEWSAQYQSCAAGIIRGQ